LPKQECLIKRFLPRNVKRKWTIFMPAHPLPRLDQDSHPRPKLPAYCRPQPGEVRHDKCGHGVGCLGAASRNDVMQLCGQRRARLAIYDLPYKFIAFGKGRTEDPFINRCRQVISSTDAVSIQFFVKSPFGGSKILAHGPQGLAKSICA
jgi:hypothetical protein